MPDPTPSQDELDAADRSGPETTAPTESELEAAIRAINEPGRLREAQDLVARAAPTLQRVLLQAINDGGYFESGHEQLIREAVNEPDAAARTRALRTLLAEETRLGMLVGVAVGFELARELGGLPAPSAASAATGAEDTAPGDAPA